MSLRAHVLIACLCTGVLAWSPRALSYSTASSISYSTLTATLSGYSRTWKDPWDADYYYDCVAWMWDDSMYSWMCYAFQTQLNYAHVFADVYSPSGLYQTTQATSFSDAQANYSLTTNAEGTWTGQGRHHAISDFYIQWCPWGFCTPPLYTGSMWFDAGSSQDQTVVSNPPALIPMSISHHFTTTFTTGDAVAILGMATELLQTNDGGGDMSCSLVYIPGPDTLAFYETDGIVSDLPDVLAIMAVDKRVHVVGEINWCDGGPTNPNGEIYGCSSGAGMIVVEHPPALSHGSLWAHEYGHNQDKPDISNPGWVMHEYLLPTNRRVTPSQCDAMRNPLNN